MNVNGIDMEYFIKKNGDSADTNEKIVKNSQKTALLKCGYPYKNSYSDEQLKDLIQAETLIALTSIRKIIIILIALGVASVLIFLILIPFFRLNS